MNVQSSRRASRATTNPKWCRAPDESAQLIDVQPARAQQDATFHGIATMRLAAPSAGTDGSYSGGSADAAAVNGESVARMLWACGAERGE